MNTNHELLLTSETVEITAAEANKLPRVSILAYSGDMMTVSAYGPLVIDLAGLQLADSIPLLADHENHIGAIVGQGSPSVRAGQLHVDGNCNLTTEAAKQIVELAKGGHKFQASIGATPLESRRIPVGDTVNVNGRVIKAASPFLLVTKSKLREVTICALGCDAGTSVAIAAKLEKEKKTMTTETNTDIFAADAIRDAHCILLETLDAKLAQHEDDIRDKGKLRMIKATALDAAKSLKQQAIREQWTTDKFELQAMREASAMELELVRVSDQLAR